MVTAIISALIRIDMSMYQVTKNINLSLAIRNHIVDETQNYFANKIIVIK